MLIPVLSLRNVLSNLNKFAKLHVIDFIFRCCGSLVLSCTIIFGMPEKEKQCSQLKYDTILFYHTKFSFLCLLKKRLLNEG